MTPAQTYDACRIHLRTAPKALSHSLVLCPTVALLLQIVHPLIVLLHIITTLIWGLRIDLGRRTVSAAAPT